MPGDLLPAFVLFGAEGYPIGAALLPTSTSVSSLAFDDFSLTTKWTDVSLFWFLGFFLTRRLWL